jgi:hypothetical protein
MLTSTSNPRIPEPSLYSGVPSRHTYTKDEGWTKTSTPQANHLLQSALSESHPRRPDDSRVRRQTVFLFAVVSDTQNTLVDSPLLARQRHARQFLAIVAMMDSGLTPLANCTRLSQSAPCRLPLGVSFQDCPSLPRPVSA